MNDYFMQLLVLFFCMPFNRLCTVLLGNLYVHNQKIEAIPFYLQYRSRSCLGSTAVQTTLTPEEFS